VIYTHNFLYKPAASFLRVLPEERGFKCEKQEKQLVAIESLGNKDRTLTLLPVDALYSDEQQYGNPVV
jgi:hypothetical protein